MIIHPDFRHHWKTRSLINKLKDHAAPLYVIELWAHCQRHRTAYFEMTDEQLKEVCMVEENQWISEEPRLLRATLETCGFIVGNPDEPTGFWVHQWEEHNKTLVNSWMNGAKGGRRKEPMGNPRDAHRQPTGHPSNSISNSIRVQNKNKVANPRVSQNEPPSERQFTKEEREAYNKMVAAGFADIANKLRSGGLNNVGS